ncbi:thiolase domain-containing protein [Methanocella sp. MCL-LM]|uniref:thiolase domain-containing protein n=1 Tax=Methanocella sp. MCL-LM TaxID=3412035 RepID=UPI003C742EE0
MRDVAIIGVGCTKFGEMWDRSFRDIFVEAGAKAIEDANLSGEEIEAMYVGNMSGGQFVQQEHIGSLIADYAGLARDFNIPATRVEAACASGGLALRNAVISVASGYHDVVVAAGVEKMTDVETGVTVDALASAADREWEGFMGATFPALYAMVARLHMHKYGTTRKQLAEVAVKNHRNAVHNPRAQFRNEITVDTVLNASMVADPFTLFDCSPITDGAAAVIVAPVEIARKYTDCPIYVLGAGQATDTISLHNRKDFCTFGASVAAGKRAYEQAGVGPQDIDLVEVHDCFTIAELLAIEDLGFFKKGESGPATERGETAIGGKIAVNASGGLKATGHPVGATGIKQAVECVEQLRGEAGKRQVAGAKIAMTHNVGGTGGTAVCHILSNEKRRK